MALVRTEAFVLKAFRYGETSMIYRLFTRDRGVVPVIAKGVRRPKSRFGASLDPFHRLQVVYYDKPGREIQTLSQVELLAGHPGVVGSLDRMEAAGTWFRFLRAVVPEHAPAETLYDLAVTALDRLDHVPPESVRRWETYHRAIAAERLGLAPRLDQCAACGADLPDRAGMTLAIEEGGLACAACGSRGGSGRMPVGSDLYGLLLLYHHPDWSLVADLDESGAAEARVQELVHRFVDWHADLGARVRGARR
ncbi:MAG: DNA repair protein RecO [Gemmatimonadetes bacterium]|nr:DNA repair protein RecO [Gemmatimonadota bacterium]